MVHKNIASALYESQIHTINMLVTYLQQNDAYKGYDSIMNIIDEFKNTLNYITFQDSTNTQIQPCKPKKTPSAYNMFIRDRIHEFKKKYPECNGHDLMRLATSAWKNKDMYTNNANNL